MAECSTLVVGLYVPGIIAYAYCNAIFYSSWTVTDRIVVFVTTIGR